VHTSTSLTRTSARGIARWQWIDAHLTQATIAYTGINLPYPLTGRQLTNRVLYVNIDGRPHWRLDNYDRAYRRGTFAPEPPILAESSGELEDPRPGPGPHEDVIRPRYERMEGFPTLWINNLATLDVTDLFVSVLSAYERDYQWHTPDRFPIEDDWAQKNSAIFALEFQNDDVRIYRVTAKRTP
jgi:hypothetical protein